MPDREHRQRDAGPRADAFHPGQGKAEEDREAGDGAKRCGLGE